jgi:putative oxidoreductase
MNRGMPDRIRATHAPAAVIQVRLMVGAVFLSEGIQKFLYPAALSSATWRWTPPCTGTST